jgi:hypothetical protein
MYVGEKEIHAPDEDAAFLHMPAVKEDCPESLIHPITEQCATFRLNVEK